MAAVSTTTVVAEVRSYLSSQHLWAAKHFARLARELDASEQNHFWQHRTYVIATVSESVAFLEATINEVLADEHDSRPGYSSKFSTESQQCLRKYWADAEGGNNRTSVLDKYNATLEICGVLPLSKGGSPYQTVKLLVDLRNWLTHYKPQSVGGDQPAPRLATRLWNRYERTGLFPDASRETWFPHDALSTGCADWAVASAQRFATEAFSRLDITLDYEKFTWTGSDAP